MSFKHDDHSAAKVGLKVILAGSLVEISFNPPNCLFDVEVGSDGQAIELIVHTTGPGRVGIRLVPPSASNLSVEDELEGSLGFAKDSHLLSPEDDSSAELSMGPEDEVTADPPAGSEDETSAELPQLHEGVDPEKPGNFLKKGIKNDKVRRKNISKLLQTISQNIQQTLVGEPKKIADLAEEPQTEKKEPEGLFHRDSHPDEPEILPEFDDETSPDEPEVLPESNDETSPDEPEVLPESNDETSPDEPEVLSESDEISPDEPEILPESNDETSPDEPELVVLEMDQKASPDQPELVVLELDQKTSSNKVKHLRFDPDMEPAEYQAALRLEETANDSEGDAKETENPPQPDSKLNTNSDQKYVKLQLALDFAESESEPVDHTSPIPVSDNPKDE